MCRHIYTHIYVNTHIHPGAIIQPTYCGLNLPKIGPGKTTLLKVRIPMKAKQSRSVVSDFVTPWTVAHQACQFTEFSRQEYWSGLPFPSPGDLPNPGIEPRSFQADTLPYSMTQSAKKKKKARGQIRKRATRGQKVTRKFTVYPRLLAGKK